MLELDWLVMPRGLNHVRCAFKLECHARDYARNLNREQHTNRWLVRKRSEFDATN